MATQMKRDLRVLAIGWYGAGNLGDELLLDVLKCWCEEHGAELTAISIDPEYTTRIHGIEAVDRQDLAGIARAMRSTDLFVLGGGGLFQTHNTFSLPALYDFNIQDIAAYARPVLMALQMGVPTLAWSQGIGPLEGDEAREITRDLFSRIDYVSVRDDASRALLADIGVDRDVVVAPDPIWAYPVPGAQPAQETGPRKVAVVLRAWPLVAGWEEHFASALRAAIGPGEATLVWLPFQTHHVPGRSDSDVGFVRSMMERFDDGYSQELIDTSHPSQAIDALASCHAVVAMRLHAQVLAIRMGKPTLCIEYDAKMASASEQVGVRRDCRVDIGASEHEWNAAMTAWRSVIENTSAIATNAEQLAQDALCHKSLLHLGLDAAISRTRTWTSTGMDWLGAWQQRAYDAALAKRDELLADVRNRECQLIEQLQSRDASVSSYEGQVAELQARAEEAAVVIEGQKVSIGEMEAAIHEFRREHELLEDRLEATDLELKGVRMEIAMKNADIEQLKDRNSNCEKQLLSLQVSSAAMQREARSLVARLESEVAANEKLVDKIYASASWKLTRPIRSLLAAMRGVEAEEKTGRQDLSSLLSQLNRLLEPALVPGADAALSRKPERTVYFFTGVPYDDIGGGQRAAQLTRVLLSRGERVVYVYAYQKWHAGQVVASQVDIPGLEHLYLNDLDLDHLLREANAGDVAVFELPHPRFKEALDLCADKHVRTVFELIDAWDSSLGGDWFSEDVLTHFIEKSAVAVGTARALQKMLVQRGRHDALYLPNAANEAIFDAYRTYGRPSDLENGKRVILYFGSLYGEWFDWESVNYTAEHCPDAVVYLIGDPPTGKTVSPKIRLLGAKNIDDLPAYLRYTDVAILPFKPGHISDAVSPIKVFEYLFMGVPVVSNDLPEVRGYPNVFIASGAEEFARLCSARNLGVKGADEFVMVNSWAARIDAIVPPRMPEKSISAIVLMHNNESIIRRCIDSLRMHGTAHLRQIIVVDNASSDRGPDIIQSEYPDVVLLRNPQNGCSSGRNLGVQHATGDVLAFFDSDQWVTGRGCFEEALTVLRERPDVGAVGWAAGWFAHGNENFGGPIVDYLPARGTAIDAYVSQGFRTDIAYLGSGGLFLKREVFDLTGGFDEFYDPTCFEDTDFSLTIKKHGLRLAYRNLQGIRHQAHQTTGASDVNAAYQKLFRRNAAYFGKKWEANSEFFFDCPRTAG